MQKLPVTKEGYERIKEELDRLTKVIKPSIIEAVATARELGDLSENAEYQEARKEQSFVEGKILALEEQLAKAEIIDVSQLQCSTVKFGAFVTVENMDNDSEVTWQVVGDVESDIKNNKISISSPLGKALIGKSVDDVVSVILPSGEKLYKILKVEFR